MLALEVIEGADRGCVIPLPPGEPQLIGRSSEAMPLTDRSISRRHAELTPDGDAWFLRDLASSNGTRVNGTGITGRVRITTGDEIQCGSARMRLIESESMPVGPMTRRTRQRPPPPGPLLPEHDTDARRVLAMVWALSGLDDLAQADIEPGLDLERAMDIIATGTASSREPAHGSCTETPPDTPPGVAIPLSLADGERVLVLHPGPEGWSSWQQSAAQFGAWLVETLDAARRVGERDRMAAMGETVAAISHAVKNILQGLQGGAGAIELAIERGDLDLARQGWPILARNLDRIHDLTFNMLAWSRTSHLEPRPGSLGDLIDEIVALQQPLFDRRRVGLRTRCADLPQVPFDPAAIHQAVLNLLVNALEAAPPRHGTVLIETGLDEERAEAILAVEDDGPGIEPDRHGMIFEPFASSRGQRGTGLGLAVTRRIVAAHGGRIVLESAPGAGARFEIRLPLDSPVGDPGDTDVPPARAQIDPSRFGP